MSTPSNPVREALLERRLSLGTWIQVGHPAVAEIFAEAGFDWIAADCEHSDIGLPEFTALARAMHGRGPAPFVRVRENAALDIRQALDMGAAGVIVPLVNSADEARRAVRAAKYPPLGERGYAFSRANAHGRDFDAYSAGANDRTAVVVMIESRTAVENIDEILDVDGVDGVFIGPYDMSGSYGVAGDTRGRVVTQACERVLKAAEAAGKSAGLHVVLPDAEAIREAVAQGFTFIALGLDTVFLDRGAREALAAARGEGA